MPPDQDIAFARIGTDVVIGPNVAIRRPQLVSIGSHVAIDNGAYITTAAEIEDYVHIGPYVTVVGGARAFFKMGNFTNLAAGCRVICGSDRFQGEGLIGPASLPEDYKDTMKLAPVVLENFANVGTNAVIMPGVTLAEGSVIGACSLVTKSTEPWTIYAGTPAKPLKQRPREKMIRYAAALGYVNGATPKR
ncbi:MAG TPA: DapH/DapD/GlmU-related protein [Pseudolabrys sp.]|nr:DapH/DapD/GlmU-related protein [Pseudolabrys sp.]